MHGGRLTKGSEMEWEADHAGLGPVNNFCFSLSDLRRHLKSVNMSDMYPLEFSRTFWLLC